MSIFDILKAAVVIVGFVLAFCTSIGLLVLSKERYEHLCERWPTIVLVPWIGGFMLFILLPSTIGGIARGEVGAWPPWNVTLWGHKPPGFWGPTFMLLPTTTFYLWAFVIPGHFCANDIAKRKGRRPWTPYVINILVGLLLCSPCNPIYRMFSR